MKVSERGSLLALTCLIIIAGFIGGILGNWIFMYVLDTYYYGVSGSYGSGAISSDEVIRSAKRTVIEDDARVTQMIAAAETTLAGIFHLTDEAAADDLSLYLPEAAVGQAVILTSDGWLATTLRLPAPPAELARYRVAVSDRRIYEIEKAVFDGFTGLTFMRLAEAQNLPVRDFAASRDLSVGQTLIGLEWSGAAEIGRLSRAARSIRLSDSPDMPLRVSGLEMRDGFLFDLNGRLAGLLQGGAVAAMDAARLSADQLLTSGTTSRTRFGVRYLAPSLAAVPVPAAGILLAPADDQPAVEPNSPAARAGLRAGDILTGFDGVSLTPFASLAALVQEYDPGDTVTVSFKRGEADLQTQVTLDEIILVP